MKTKLIIILFILPCLALMAQESKPVAIDSSFRVSVEILTSASSSLDSNTVHGYNWGASPHLRIMWEPDHRLKIGVESGYVSISHTRIFDVETEFGTSDLKSDIVSVPILLIFKMNFGFIDLYGGTGGVLLISRLESFGEKKSFTDWDYCSMGGLGYRLDILDWMSVGININTYYIPQLTTTVFSGGLNVRFVLYKW